MSGDPREDELARLQQRARELAATHRELRRMRADVAEEAAAVHHEAARVHEELGDAAVLAPQQLRDHAEQDRVVAERERAALDEDPGSRTD